MIKKLSLLGMMLMLCMTIQARRPDKCLLVGTVQFPTSMAQVPSLSIYWGGHKITSDIDTESKSLSFTISQDRCQNVFYIVIADNISVSTNENTVEYLRVAPQTSYKGYKLVRHKHVKPIPDIPGKKLSAEAIQKYKPMYSWEIEEVKLMHNGRIPDNAIIIFCNADYVKEITGGNEFQLPRIILSNDIMLQDDIDEQFVKLLFKSLDLNTFHASIEQEVKRDELTTMIAMNLS